MAWDYVSQSGPVTVTSGNITLTEPAGAAQGDLLVACIAYRSNAAFTLPAGWALANNQQSSGDVDTTDGIASGVMAYIVRGASAPSYVFTRTAGDVGLGRVLCYRGNSATPYDTGSSSTRPSVGTAIGSGTITTAEDNELIIGMAACGDSYTTTAFLANTDPTTASGATDTTTEPTAGTWIERADSSTTSGADTALAIADAIKATAGATGAFGATTSGAGRSAFFAAAFKISSGSVYEKTAAETLTVAEAASVSHMLIGARAEALTVIEAQAGLGIFGNSAAEVLIAAETQAGFGVFGKSAAEIITVIDSANATGMFSKSLAENITVVDAQTSGLLQTGAAAEVLIVAETISASPILVGDIAESLTIIETIASILTAVGAGIEALTAVTVEAATSVMSAARDEVLTIVDAVTGGVSIEVSRSEILTIVETIIGTVSGPPKTRAYAMII